MSHGTTLSSPFPSRMLTAVPSCLPSIRRQHRAETTCPQAVPAFHPCLREERIEACECQHGPWAQAWDKPASCSATESPCLPCEHDKARSRHQSALAYLQLMWIFLQCVPFSCCPWVGTGTVGSDLATFSLSLFFRGKIILA